MAKVNITVDTESGTLSVAVNGSAVDNVSYAYFSQYQDYEGKNYVGVEVCSYIKNDDGTRVRTIITASDSKTAKDYRKAGAKEVPLKGTKKLVAFVAPEDKDTKADIFNFIRK